MFSPKPTVTKMSLPITIIVFGYTLVGGIFFLWMDKGFRNTPKWIALENFNQHLTFLHQKYDNEKFKVIGLPEEFQIDGAKLIGKPNTYGNLPIQIEKTDKNGKVEKVEIELGVNDPPIIEHKKLQDLFKDKYLFPDLFLEFSLSEAVNPGIIGQIGWSVEDPLQIFSINPEGLLTVDARKIKRGDMIDSTFKAKIIVSDYIEKSQKKYCHLYEEFMIEVKSRLLFSFVYNSELITEKKKDTTFVYIDNTADKINLGLITGFENWESSLSILLDNNSIKMEIENGSLYLLNLPYGKNFLNLQISHPNFPIDEKICLVRNDPPQFILQNIERKSKKGKIEIFYEKNILHFYVYQKSSRFVLPDIITAGKIGSEEKLSLSGSSKVSRDGKSLQFDLSYMENNETISLILKENDLLYTTLDIKFYFIKFDLAKKMTKEQWLEKEELLKKFVFFELNPNIFNSSENKAQKIHVVGRSRLGANIINKNFEMVVEGLPVIDEDNLRIPSGIFIEVLPDTLKISCYTQNTTILVPTKIENGITKNLIFNISENLSRYVSTESQNFLRIKPSSSKKEFIKGKIDIQNGNARNSFSLELEIFYHPAIQHYKGKFRRKKDNSKMILFRTNNKKVFLIDETEISVKKYRAFLQDKKNYQKIIKEVHNKYSTNKEYTTSQYGRIKIVNQQELLKTLIDGPAFSVSPTLYPHGEGWIGIASPVKTKATDDHPMIGVSWFEAYAYSVWTNSQVRLPNQNEIKHIISKLQTMNGRSMEQLKNLLLKNRKFDRVSEDNNSYKWTKNSLGVQHLFGNASEWVFDEGKIYGWNNYRTEKDNFLIERDLSRRNNYTSFRCVIPLN